MRLEEMKQLKVGQQIICKADDVYFYAPIGTKGIVISNNLHMVEIGGLNIKWETGDKSYISWCHGYSIAIPCNWGCKQCPYICLAPEHHDSGYTTHRHVNGFNQICEGSPTKAE